MAVTLYDQFGGSSTPTLTTGSDNCDYVIVVGPTYQERYIKDGATSYRFYNRTDGAGGLTSGHIIGVSITEGGSGGSTGGASALGELSDVGTATPTSGHALIGDGDSFESRAIVLADVSDMVEGAEFVLKVTNDADALPATGDGKFYFPVPASLNGHNITDVVAHVSTVSSSGNITVALRRLRVATAVDVLSTLITIEASEKSSLDATTQRVINASNDDLATDDWLIVDLDGAGTGAKGLSVYIKTQVP